MDLYTVLGLDKRASLTDIKRAYRRLARKYHPDINPGDRAAEAFFRRIVLAYETLSDPERRRRYDTVGEGGPQVAEVSYEFQGFDFSATAEGAQASTFGELFADVFRRPQASADRTEDGADLHAEVALSFEEAMRGAERSVTLMRVEACHSCRGTGALQSAEARCQHCQGSGHLRLARGHMVFTKTCPHCGGSGRRRQRSCPTCGGEGAQPRSETVAVRIPAGIEDGARVRIPSKGHAGRRGGRTGDLYVMVKVAPHPWFTRDGDDLHVVVPIAIHEAALGARIDVPSPDGPIKLRVPPGTQSGQRFRLRDRGVASARTSQRGDLVVEVRLVLPRLVDERSKELLREFGRINSESVRKELGV